MCRAWRLVLVGPADERSIVDSALRQAGFEVAQHLEAKRCSQSTDFTPSSSVSRSGASVVAGSVHDVLAATQRNQALVIQLVDDDQQPAVSGAAALRRPLQSPPPPPNPRMIEAHQSRC